VKTAEQDSLLARLIAAEVEFVLAGGFAAVVHGATLVTRDVDVLLHFTEENLVKLQAALRDLHPVHRLSGNREPLEVTRYRAAEWKNLYLSTTAGVLDCLGEVRGIGRYEDALSVSEVRTYAFGACRILTLEALIAAKEAMGRPHDMLTVLQLRAVQERLRQQ
jgi:hypothetical protein